MRCYHRPLQFSILLVSLLFACAPTEAKDLPIQGGPGGSYFRSECGAGQWVIGVTIRHGLWVDAMRLICAGYSSISRVVPDFDLDFQGQQGGSLTPATVICSNDTYVTGIKFGTTWDGNDPKYVDYVEVTCASVVVFSGTPPFAVYGLIGTSTCLDTGEGCSNQPFSLSCDLGDAATGFHGRSGIYVDALGLICGPSPALVAATSQAPPTGTPPPPPQLTPDQITYLNAHNERRAKHCVPKLTVSLELERAAKAWADACVYEHDESIRGSVGENIAAAWPTLTSTKAIGDWYDEIGRYDFDHPIDSYNTPRKYAISRKSCGRPQGRSAVRWPTARLPLLMVLTQYGNSSYAATRRPAILTAQIQAFSKRMCRALVRSPVQSRSSQRRGRDKSVRVKWSSNAYMLLN
jgi:hypothetical protein